MNNKFSNAQHVIRGWNGGWSVKKTGASRASKNWQKKEDAIDWARGIARNQKSDVYIHSKDGKVQSKESYR